MYAIVEINGQQFKAEAGKKLFVHHIQNAENGATVEFDKVLLVDKDEIGRVVQQERVLPCLIRPGKQPLHPLLWEHLR